MKKYILTLTLSIFFLGQSYCQEKIPVNSLNTSAKDSTVLDTIGFIKTDNIEVIKAFEAKLTEANMLVLQPKLPEVKIIPKQYNYDVTIIPYNIVYPEPVIKPIAMRKDEPIKVNENYIKAGYGNLKNGYAELRLHKRFSDLIDWDLSVDFDNVDNTANIAHQKHFNLKAISSQDFTVLETARLATYIKSGVQNRNFYYQAEDRLDASILNEEEASRKINTFGVGLSFFNTEALDLKVDYRLDLTLDFTKISDLVDKELNTYLFGSITKNTTKNLSFTFQGGIDYNKIGGNNDIIGLFEPIIVFSGNKAKISAGLDLAYADSKANLFPSIEIKYAIDDRLLQAFIGANQEYYRNNQFNSTLYSPFSKGMDSLATNITQDIYGGVKGDVYGLSYSAKGGFKNIKNQRLFNVDFSDEKRRLFMSLTDLKSAYISGTIEMPVKDFIDVGSSITQNFFTDVTAAEMWHIPSLEFNAWGRIKFLNDKIIVNPSIYIRDKVNGLNHEGTKEELDELIDFNLAIEANPSKNFGIWVRGLNLLDRSYRRWLGYENYGIQFQGGIKAIF